MSTPSARSEMLTGPQIRAARALIGMSAFELARLTGLAINTIRRAESSAGAARVTSANLRAIQSALEAGGVEFLPRSDTGEGVRFAQ